jgi:ankyrin repeat protein
MQQAAKLTAYCGALVLTACMPLAPRDRVVDYIALIYAAENGNDVLVEALLDRGAPVDALGPDVAGTLSIQAVEMDSPLQAAARAGNFDIVRLLLKHKPWVDHRCCDSPAALGIAAAAGNIELVKVLLEAGADPNIRSGYGQDLPNATPLDAARKNGHLDVVRKLEEARHMGSNAKMSHNDLLQRSVVDVFSSRPRQRVSDEQGR